MKVWLRDVTLEDGKKIVQWRNNVKVINHCMDKTLITEESNEVYFNNYVATGKVKQFIVDRSDEEWAGIFGYSIGTVYLKDFDNENYKCELGMYSGIDIEWNCESQKLAIDLLLKKAFEEYGMHKVYSYVFADCKEEIEVLQKSGFIQEGKFIAEILDKDEYKDVLRMAINKSNK